jgi:fungal STAND N-terminal Goodbye domain
MSQNLPTTPATRFQLIFNDALEVYKKRTKNNLATHPLAAQLQFCDSPSAVLIVLQEQAQRLQQSRSNDERLTKWLGPTVNILYALSETLGEGVSLVNSKILFRSAFGV